jgi:glycosyltransferase involved in cell wall biosynthesis
MGTSRRAEQRISLIIPCYNAGRYIAEALYSVLGQSRIPDEIVVVDDGSTDHSAQIVQAFGGVRLIRRPHEGAACALNSGLAKTSGALVAFLDADDLWPPDSLDTRFLALDAAPDHDYAYGRMEPFVSPELEGTADMPHFVLAGGSARVLGATLFRRRLFDRTGHFDPGISHGYVLGLIGKAQAAGFKGLEIDRLVLRRRIHDSNSVYQHERLARGYFQALRSSLAHRRGTAP